MESNIVDSIYLQKIVLENWAQFDDQKIEFPIPTNTTDDTAIIYFLARNGSGKTRLFQAIRVGLFGKEDLSIERNPDMFQFYPILKKEILMEKLKSGENITNQTIKISLTFKEFNKSNLTFFHKITRIFIFSDFKLEQENGNSNKLKAKLLEEKLKYEYKDGPSWAEKPVDELLNKIDLWFPTQIRDFYFFDGEKITDLMIKNDEEKRKYISDVILSKSDYKKLEKILEAVKYRESEFEKKAATIPRHGELVQESRDILKDIRIKKKKIKQDIENTNKKIDELTNRITTNQKELDQLGITPSRLQGITKKRSKLNKYRELDQKFTANYNLLNDLLGNQNEKIYNFQWILISDLIEQVYNDLNERYKKNEVPSKLHSAIYDIILTRNTCICSDTPLNDDQKKKILSERNEAIDEKLNESAKEFLKIISTKREENLVKIEKITESKNDCVELINQRNELGDRPEDDEGDELLFSKFLDIRKKIDDDRGLLDAEKRKKNEHNTKLKDNKKAEDDTKNLLQRRRTREGNVDKADIWEFLATETRKMFETIKTEISESIKENIKDQTNNTFLTLIEPKNEYDRVFIDESWNFGYYMKSSPNTPIYGEFGPSKGQFHILGLSFLHSISGTTSCRIPIILDTPLGRIDEIHKKNLGSNISKLFTGTQVILFLTGSEAKDMIQYIAGKHGMLITNTNNLQAYCSPIDSEEESLIKSIEKVEEENRKLQEKNSIEINGVK